MISRVRAEKVGRLVRSATGRFVVIFTQFDPDAAACAAAFRDLAQFLNPDLPLQIFYAGHIGHAQNRAIVEEFDLLTFMSPIQDLAVNQDDVVVLVDSSDLDDSRLPLSCRPLDPMIVVDHHHSQLPPEGNDRFFQVERVGAASTQMIELCSMLGLAFSDATAILLALGIYTDTKALVAASRRDRRAYGKVTKQIDPLHMAHLIRHSLPQSYFDHLLVALQNMEEKEGRIVVGLGEIDPETGDDLSSIADELLRKNGIHLVVVWAITGESIRVSARSMGLAMPLDQFLKNCFGNTAGAKSTPDGREEGGARLDIKLNLKDFVRVGIRELIFST